VQDRCRIKVQACGVCHSDVLTKEGALPGIQYPRVPGHEVAGIIDELGAGVSEWKQGQRVGVGWHGGHDGTCLSCRRGDFINCRNQKIAGISYDGGYQEYMVAPVEALAAIPDSLSAVDAAPLLCAGITTFNALRHSGALPVTLCSPGIGGLGHLGIQLRTSLVIESRRSGAAPKTRRSQRNLERACTSIAKRLTRRRVAEMGGAQAILGDSAQLESDVRANRWSGDRTASSWW
jgi:D-arabinose 1-dehydrogenase-like Zn-dependent alcohol dehydrogenase